VQTILVFSVQLCFYIIWSRTFTSLQMPHSVLLIKLLVDLNKTNSFDLGKKKSCKIIVVLPNNIY